MAKYVLAISGGIDSMVLIDLIANDYQGFRTNHFGEAKWPNDFMVAHFDHGIRGEVSHQDAKFVVKTVRAKYGVPVQVGLGRLSADTSEEMARQVRYNFLRQTGESAKIVTAHHRDDLLETVVMNLIRGTGWRGLAPMSQPDVVRPLLAWSKVDIATYALRNDLDWREDQTNYSPKYLRNRLRSALAKCPEADKCQLADLAMAQMKLRREIESELGRYVCKHVTGGNGQWYVRRYDIIMLPDTVALEVLRSVSRSCLTLPQLRSLLLFIKVGRPGKRMMWKYVVVQLTKDMVAIGLVRNSH